MDNPKDANRKLLKFINEFGKVAGYKINTKKCNTQKSVAFLYTNNERSEREMKETIPFTIASKKIKYLGINLPKETSLVAQWLRICLPMQGTRVWALVQEDPTCHGATKPVYHNYWTCALEPTSHNYGAWVPQLLKPTCLESMLHNKRSHCNEKPMHHNEEYPLLATTRESSCAATKTQCSQNI